MESTINVCAFLTSSLSYIIGTVNITSRNPINIDIGKFYIGVSIIGFSILMANAINNIPESRGPSEPLVNTTREPLVNTTREHSTEVITEENIQQQ